MSAKNNKASPAKKRRNESNGKGKKRPAKKRSNNRKKTSSKRSIIISLLAISLIAFIAYLFYLDNRITQRFEGRIWQLPAHVYARPLELFVGKKVSSKQVLFELDYLNYQQVQQLHHKYRVVLP